MLPDRKESDFSPTENTEDTETIMKLRQNQISGNQSGTDKPNSIAYASVYSVCSVGHSAV